MNRVTNPILMLVPYEVLGSVLLLFLVLGGLCMIVGAKKAAYGLIATAVAVPFVSVVVEAIFTGLFSFMPPWMVQVTAWLILILIYIAIFAGLMSLLFGQRAWDHAKGHLLADAIKALARMAFRWQMIPLWLGLAALIWWRNS